MRMPDSPLRIHFIQNERDVSQAVQQLVRFDVLGFDVETYHSVDRYTPAFHPTDGAKMRLAQFGTPEGDAYVFDLYRVSKHFLHLLFPNRFLCVGQNIKFEMKFLMHECGIYDFGPCWDTMIAEQLISKGAVARNAPGYVKVGLDNIAERQLGIYLPKDEQASDWYMNELSQSQIEYAARDAIVVLPIFDLQTEKLYQQSQVRVAELEMDAIPAYASMENNGMYLNGDKWLEVCNQTAAELNEVKKQLWHMLGQQQTLFEEMPTFNLDSKPQTKLAFHNIGIQLPLNKKGELSLSSDLLKPIADREEVRLYLKYSKLAKALQSYGPDWLSKRGMFDGRIHCSIFQIGAETGRSAAAYPNMMQIKKDNLYRNCFEAQNGWVFVDADYSQCELRILTEYSRDPNLLFAYDNQYDLHTYTASLIYKVAQEMVEAFQRAIAKNLNFGIIYGIGVAKFAMQAGIPLGEAEVIMGHYLRHAYPLMARWLDDRARSILYSMEAETMSGRKRRYNVDLEDKQERAAMQRNGKNMPIQGTNADITKRALALAYKQFKGDFARVKMVMVIHDEIILESRPDVAEQNEYDLKQVMLKAEREFLKRVPCVVDSNKSLVWCKEPSEQQMKDADDVIRAYG